MNLYGLLHVERSILLRAPDDAGTLRIDTYIRNAVTLANSARCANMRFAVLTNAHTWVEGRLAALGLSGRLDMIEAAFERDVPEGIAFHSAHFKLDAIASFGQGDLGEAVALVDLDMVVLRHFALPPEPGLYVYDIWDQVAPAYGAERIMDDLETFGVARDQRQWFGGEFIAGRPEDFRQLAARIERIWPDYVKALGSTHHTGDEMVVTAALLQLTREGMALHDAGAAQMVARWWSVRTLAPFPPLAKALPCAMLHLPADKDFLAGYAGNKFIPEAFQAIYVKNTKNKKFSNILKNFLELARGRKMKYLPKFS